MDNKDKMAFPFYEPGTGFGSVSEGLTKREYFAAKAMQGLIGNWEASCKICDSDPRYDGTNFMNVVAINSVEFADALLAELSKS